MPERLTCAQVAHVINLLRNIGSAAVIMQSHDKRIYDGFACNLITEFFFNYEFRGTKAVFVIIPNGCHWSQASQFSGE